MATLAVALQACVPGPPDGPGAGEVAPVIAGDVITVTTLADPTRPAMVDSAVEAAAISAEVPSATKPKPRPQAVRGAAAAEGPVAEDLPVAEVVKSRGQLRCEKGGGQWTAIAGGEARSCVRRTRDGGKACSREDQCEGQCLARSKTCAPFDPLWGCNDVLQKDGSRVTLCLN